ncbi:HWE histidine kinase domain-containing protein [Reyranella sp.]|uniref:HWE histidine kinase domain-containing protein n=1 Tax=Reyranella sp. TaxID=1929291 RepID=UPI0011FF959E|nr:HWE histidine kinase domain-containing protein [Reyranella sp.]TAJ82340.1 MAG: response regulator [Reyranella sp.]
MDKVGILLIDDQPAKLLSYEVILAELGETLIKANSPHEALGLLLKTENVAVVLIDVVMPQIDGFQLAAMIREHPRFQKLAIIFVSAVQIAETDHLRGYEIGAVDYVTVPVVPEVLRAKVRVFIELYRKTRQLEALNAELEARVAARTAELETQTERLRRSEERRSIALGAGNMGAWEVDVASGRIEWDDGPYRIFDVDPSNFTPTIERIEAMIHPEDRERNSIAAISAGAGSRFQVEFRIIRPNGEVRWCFGAGVISRDTKGDPIHLTGVTVDITDRKRAEERQFVLAREVDHRAKNMLAVVLSVLRLTKAKSTPEFVTTVEGRIHALAATHNLLSATHWQGASLGKIVDEEMAPYRTDHRDRITVGGPPATLLPATAQAMALAVHELATNAAKYGAFSTDTGHLSLLWQVDDQALVVEWTETGGPPTSEPKSLGFGLSIVRSSIEAQFRGGVLYEWLPQGLHCRLSIPRAQLVASGPAPITEQPPVKPLPTRSNRSLTGHRLLMVEDEVLVGIMAKRILEDLGATVIGPYGNLAEGLAAARSERFDAAILDFNLAGELADPLADLLIAYGVPFAFITGYQRDSIDRRYTSIPLLSKPLEADALEGVLLSLLKLPAQRHLAKT